MKPGLFANFSSSSDFVHVLQLTCFLFSYFADEKDNELKLNAVRYSLSSPFCFVFDWSV